MVLYTVHQSGVSMRCVVSNALMLQIINPCRDVWLGVRRINGKWTWADGQQVANVSEIPISGVDLATTTDDCMYMKNRELKIITTPCSTKYKISCHTPTYSEYFYKYNPVKV